MYFESKIYLRSNYSLTELREIFRKVLKKENDIDRVLDEMECISNNLIADIKSDTIYAFKTTNYYYLFHYEPGLIIAQIELKAYDRNLKSNLKSIFTTLEMLRKQLRKDKKTKQSFSPLKLLDTKGSYTGISFSKKLFWEALGEGIKSPKYLELIGLSLTAYIFLFANLNDYLKSIKPTIIVAFVIYIVQVIQKTFEVYNNEKTIVQ
ncbi:MAG: hypothetical protein Fur0023_02210 [Bacteroidia bacterium]